VTSPHVWQSDRLTTERVFEYLQPGWMMINQAIRPGGYERFPAWIGLGINLDDS
jgi:hypothetical protein